MVKDSGITAQSAIAVLDRVMDPEVPVISVVELGIVRSVSVDDGHVSITITPTYSGCPAMNEIEADIQSALMEAGASSVQISRVLSPPWTTNDIGDEAKEKLRAYGIAPPSRVNDNGLVSLGRSLPKVNCPWCASSRTELKSEFGSTACKSIHVCLDCSQPFEEFKPI